MSKYTLPVLACAVLCFFTAYTILDSRLYVTYLDYRMALHVNCIRCGALGARHETERLNGVTKVSPSCVPWTLKHKGPLRSYLSVERIYEPDSRCKHHWEVLLTQGNNDIRREFYNYELPTSLYSEYAREDILLLLGLSPFIIGLLYLCHNCKQYRLVLSCVALLAAMVSLWCLIYSIVVPLGCPITDLLAEYRRAREDVVRRGMKQPCQQKVVNLLSEEPIMTCLQRSGFVKPAVTVEDCEIFPVRLLKKEQARLAAAVAPFNAELAWSYFYGDNQQITTDFNTLMRLMRGNNKLKILMEKQSELDSFSASRIVTNRFGTIVVVYELESSETAGWRIETTFVGHCVDQDFGSDKCWLPISNLDGSYMTYYGRLYLQNSW